MSSTLELEHVKWSEIIDELLSKLKEIIRLN